MTPGEPRPDMATERQIAANRRNASKSSGPRSAAGKKRASDNAYRHGLFSRHGRTAVTQEIAALARIIAGEATGAIALEHARAAAEAEIELKRIRDAKRALIDSTAVFGSMGTPRFLPTDPREGRWLIAMEKSLATMKGRKPELPEPEDFLSTMPQEEPERSCEAMRRVAPELTKLIRYEQRARGRRNRAIRKLRGLT
jgi:hypothetical protein